MPPTPERPAFTKLHGIESFPDLPFIDNDGEVVRAARTDDPPIRGRPRATAMRLHWTCWLRAERTESGRRSDWPNGENDAAEDHGEAELVKLDYEQST